MAMTGRGSGSKSLRTSALGHVPSQLWISSVRKETDGHCYNDSGVMKIRRRKP